MNSCHLEPREEGFWRATAEMGRSLLKLRDPGLLSDSHRESPKAGRRADPLLPDSSPKVGVVSERAALLAAVHAWDMRPEGSGPGVIFKVSFCGLTVRELLVADGAPLAVGVSREGFWRGHK